MKTQGRIAFCSGLLALMLFESIPALAQRATGSIVGTIVDASGSVVPKAVLTLTNTGTSISKQTTSNQLGNYLFSDLPVGDYELKAELPGFSRVVISGIILNVDNTFRADITMRPGDVATTVAVEAHAPLVDTDDSTFSQVIEHKTIVGLPLNGRDYQQLQLLNAGTVSLTNFQTSIGVTGGAVNFSNNGVVNVSNGGRPGKNSFLIDGGDAYDYRSRTTSFVPILDSITEFKQQKSQFSAEYGSGNSVTNVITQSGTNAFHGTLWNFLRNDKLDARSFFSLASRPEALKRNQFGFVAGGPVEVPGVYHGKGRTFFFVGWEALRLRTAQTFVSTVATPEFRAGDFSRSARRIFDPASTAPDPSTPNRFLRTQFPQNRIPASSLDSVATFFLPFFPFPNVSGALASNFVVPAPQTRNNDQFVIKIDEAISSRDRISFRYTRNRLTGFTGGAFHPGTSGAIGLDDTVHNGTVTYTHTFGATAVLELRGSPSRNHTHRTTPAIGDVDYVAQSGIKGFEALSSVFPGYPNFNMTGYAGLAAPGAYPLNQPRNDYAWSGSLTKTQASHFLKFGVDTRFYQQNLTNGGTPRGGFTFTGTYSSDPNAAGSTGDAFADFLLGYPFSVGRQPAAGWFYLRFKTYSAYAQDDWKITPTLTLNLGFRYDLMIPAREKNQNIAVWVPEGRNGRGAIVVQSQKPLQQPTIDLVPRVLPVYAPLLLTSDQLPNFPSGLRTTDQNNVAPRVGFAWRPFGGSDTVVRGGYGIFYVPYDGGRAVELPSTLFQARETDLSNTTPIPTRTTRQFYGPGELSLDPKPTIFGSEVNFNITYMQQWSLGIQRTLPGRFLLETSYVGSKGTFLERVRQLNDPPPGSGVVANRRPYPDFGRISYREASGSSSYHALQVRLERQFGSGLQMLVSYANSKLLDDGSVDTDEPQDSRNLRLEKGLAAYDVAQRFVSSWIWELPIFKNNSNRVIQQALVGWKLGGILTLQSGLPFTPMFSGATANTGVAAIRPDRLRNGAFENPTVARWFDPAAFAAPPAFAFGNSGRNILRMDGITNLDFSVLKNFRITEGTRLEFRGEFFNLPNHADFGPPQATVNVATAGVVSTSSPPRIIQFGLKLYF